MPNGTTTLGGGQPFPIVQPSLGLHAIIGVDGAFPTQSNQTGGEAPFLGEISWFAGNFAPSGWALADGQLLSIAQYQALFSILGTTYGGNGIFDFALPDLEDRLAIGTDSALPLGELEGTDTDTLTYAQLPVGYPATLPTVSNVPEPDTVTIMALGSATLLLATRRNRHGRAREARRGRSIKP